MFTSRVQRDYSRSEEYMFKVYIENKLSNKYLQQSTMIWRVFTPLLWSNVKFRTIRHFNIGMTANITIFSTCPKIYHNSPQIFVTKKTGFYSIPAPGTLRPGRGVRIFIPSILDGTGNSKVRELGYSQFFECQTWWRFHGFSRDQQKHGLFWCASAAKFRWAMMGSIM